MKINKLTLKQESQLIEFREECRKIGLNTNPVDKPNTIKHITQLYSFIDKKPPVFIFCPSPLFCNLQINFVKILFKKFNLETNLGTNLGTNLWDNLRDNLRDNLGDNLGDNLRDNLWDNLGDNLWANLRTNLGTNLRANLETNLGDNLETNLETNLGDNLETNLRTNLGTNLRDNLGDNLWDNLGANLRDNLWDNLGANLRDFIPTYFWGQQDIYWICFYKFPEIFLGIKYNQRDLEKLNCWYEIAKSCNWFWCFENYCFVSDRPSDLYFDENYKLHNKNKSSYIFRDGWCDYNWHGIKVPKKWICEKSKITKNDIINEKNAEKRRCLREILGIKKYYNLLGGVIEIDKDNDQYGNQMILYRSKGKDEITDDYIQYLSVIDPSTGREYILHPPNQNSKNVWEAKSSTFNNEKIKIRHGDVGMLDLSEEFNQPIYES